MIKHILIGVDGGATKTEVRIENSTGDVLGQTIGGPANIRLSVEASWHAVYAAITKILQPYGISFTDNQYRFHAGMGIAGCEITSAHHAFLQQTRVFFHTLIVTSDAHIACLGAHQGEDGAIIIAGTGVVGYQIHQGRITKVGGWGFPHDDEGGGAWLGLQAIKATLKWLDKRADSSPLAEAVFRRFNNDQTELVFWANQANSTRFAELAPLVIEWSKQGDEVAIEILKQASRMIDHIGYALEINQVDQQIVLPCALVGGVAPFLKPYLDYRLQKRLTACASSPMDGAMLLARKQLRHLS